MSDPLQMTELIDSPNFLKVLKTVLKNSDPDVVTPSMIRQKLEQELGLDKDTLKPLKKRVNKLIDETFANLEGGSEEDTGDQSESDREKAMQGKARVDVDESEQDEEEVVPKSKKRSRARAALQDSDDDESAGEGQGGDVSPNENDTSDDDDNKSSDDSDLESEAPPKKKKKETSSAKKTSASKKTSAEPIKVTGKSEETIKRLKSYISKCGVVKRWNVELADCRSAKAQIDKLKSILEDLGVEGRPTLEKCKAVKDARELRSELDSLSTENIISGGRRSRRAQTSTQPRPAPVFTSDKDEDSDNDGDGKSTSDDDNSDEDASDASEASGGLDVAFLGDQSDSE
ncbi:hypothetical protein DM01DRAFT_1335744 [Hesseltinella vesiculosa]|uniref:DEK-C domain-containing protein n=1 Tax=Hesseltinella vesiculosa TaxID=101127 RepID=A0A1X2GJX1_9FUNG|nr:hypothetical protein DM01DRAFT_1335744 [Hesseltinella vesiculosa]